MIKQELKQMETELTHSYNMLSLAGEAIEDAIESGNTSKLTKVLSIITKANDAILEQLENIVELNVKKTA